MTPYGFSDILKPCFLSLSPFFFHFTDQINCTLLLHLNLSHLLFYYFPPHLKDASILSFLMRKLLPYHFPLCCSPNPLPWKWSSLTLLLSAVILGCVLTYEDLKLGTSNKKEYVTFVFLSLYHNTQHVIFYRFISFTSKFIFSFSFTGE